LGSVECSDESEKGIAFWYCVPELERISHELLIHDSLDAPTANTPHMNRTYKTSQKTDLVTIITVLAKTGASSRKITDILNEQKLIPQTLSHATVWRVMKKVGS
jgi:hypothetical protein